MTAIWSRLRLLSPLGRYPRASVSAGASHLVVSDEVVFSLVPVSPPETHGLTHAHYSELEVLALEEVRFFASLALSVHPHEGMIWAYPVPFHAEAKVEPVPGQEAFEEAKRHISALNTRHKFGTRGLVMPPLAGGPAYETQEEPPDLSLLTELIQNIRLTDFVLMRGLGSLVKANMLWQRREFQDSAAMALHVALDASFQLVLRKLRAENVNNPSADDAGMYIDRAFNPDLVTGPYFRDYYEDRIRTVHPSNRFGDFAFPPLAADDFFDLRSDLLLVYVFLITGHVWNK